MGPYDRHTEDQQWGQTVEQMGKASEHLLSVVVGHTAAGVVATVELAYAVEVMQFSSDSLNVKILKLNQKNSNKP